MTVGSLPHDPAQPHGLRLVSAHAFPKAARLTKTDEFSSVFALRPKRRSTHFVLYVRENGLAEARLGIVVGKKFAKRAAERNLVKRMVREHFRQRRDELAGRDVLFRLQSKFPRAEFTSRSAVRRICHTELTSLMEVAARPLAPASTPSAKGANAPAGKSAPGVAALGAAAGSANPAVSSAATPVAAPDAPPQDSQSPPSPSGPVAPA